MKKGIFSIAMVFAMGAGAFAAKNEGPVINRQVMMAFNKQFADAKNVKWEENKDNVKAEFTMNDQVFFAYYNNGGGLTAVVRNIISGQLPIRLLTSLKNDYKDYWISDLFEKASGNESTYYVTLEDADSKIVLRSNGTSGWQGYAKTKKDAE